MGNEKSSKFDLSFNNFPGPKGALDSGAENRFFSVYHFKKGNGKDAELSSGYDVRVEGESRGEIES